MIHFSNWFILKNYLLTWIRKYKIQKESHHFLLCSLMIVFIITIDEVLIGVIFAIVTFVLRNILYSVNYF